MNSSKTAFLFLDLAFLVGQRREGSVPPFPNMLGFGKESTEAPPPVPGSRFLPAGGYPPVAVRVLVGDRAAPGVVHPAGAPAAAAAAPAATAGHLVAQVRAGLGAGHATQRVDPRVGASVAAHVGEHSESRSAPRHKRGRAGSEKVEGFKREAPSRELGRAQKGRGDAPRHQGRPGRCKRGAAGGGRARGRRRAGTRRGRKSCGSEGGEGSEELGRGWVLVLVGGGASLLPAGTRHRGHTWPVSSQGGVRPPRLPAPRGCHRRARDAPPHLCPPARGSALRLRGPRKASRGGVPETRAPGAATEGRTCAGGGRSLSASAATAGKARPLLFRISSVPGRK